MSKIARLFASDASSLWVGSFVLFPPLAPSIRGTSAALTSAVYHHCVGIVERVTAFAVGLFCVLRRTCGTKQNMVFRSKDLEMAGVAAAADIAVVVKVGSLRERAYCEHVHHSMDPLLPTFPSDCAIAGSVASRLPKPTAGGSEFDLRHHLGEHFFGGVVRVHLTNKSTINRAIWARFGG